MRVRLAALTCVLAFAFALGFAAVADAETWYLQNPSPTAASLSDCAFFADGHGWAIGEDGTVLQTQDGGAHWKVDHDAPGTTYLTCLATVGTGTVVFGGDPNGVLRVSTDGGQTWGQQNTGSATPIQSLLFTSDTEGWAGDQNTGLFHTTNGGQTWSPVPTGAAWGWVQALAQSGGGRVIAAISDQTLYTDNDGSAWTTASVSSAYNVPWQPHLHGMVFGDADHGLAAGDDYYIYRTSDGGASWTPILRGFSYGNMGYPVVAFRDALHAYAINGRSVWASSDSGATWKVVLARYIDHTGAVTAGPDVATSVHFADTGLGWMTDSYGGVYYTLSGGSVWCRSTETFTQDGLKGGQFMSETTGYLVGDNGPVASGRRGNVWMTTDAGGSWTSVAQTAGQLSAISLAPDGSGWAVGPAGSAYGTIMRTDGKGHWTQTYHAGAPLNAVWTNDGVKGWLAGDYGMMLYTDDAGAHWTQQDSSASSNTASFSFSDVHVLPSGEGWAYGASGLAGALLHTSNDGATWTLANKPAARCYRMAVTDAGRVFLTGFTGMYYSDDGGTTWNPQLNGQYIIDIHFTDPIHGYLRTSNGYYTSGYTSGAVYTTSDGGTSWQPHPAPWAGGSRVVGYGASFWVYGTGGEIAYNGGDGSYVPVPETHTNVGSAWSSAPFDLHLWADDALGVDDTYVQMNDGMSEARAFSSTGGGAGGWKAWRFPVAITKEGVTPIRYYSVDVAGTTETVKTAYIRLDTSTPKLNITAAAKNRRKAVVKLRAGDAYSGVNRLVWAIDGGRAHTVHARLATISVTRRGKHTLVVYAVDNAGHKSGKQTRTFMVTR